MNDERIIELLLEAEPDELRGVGPGEVARLVREREDVRTLADRILAGLADANRTLDVLAATSRLSRPAGMPAEGRTTAGRRVPGLRPALAAAVVVVAIATMLLRSPDRAPGVKLGNAGGHPGLAASLAAGSDHPFAVFETENPDIVVVWLFPEEESR